MKNGEQKKKSTSDLTDHVNRRRTPRDACASARGGKRRWERVKEARLSFFLVQRLPHASLPRRNSKNTTASDK